MSFTANNSHIQVEDLNFVQTTKELSENVKSELVFHLLLKFKKNHSPNKTKDKESRVDNDYTSTSMIKE